jgi:hypothetical protein
MMFEDGTIAYNPITCEKVLMIDEPAKIGKIMNITEEFRRLLSPEIEEGLYRIPPKDVGLSVDLITNSPGKERLLKEFHERMIGMFREQGKIFDYELVVLR